MLKTWRTPELEEVYAQFRQNKNGDNRCDICRITPKQEHGSFLIIPNEFPYNMVCTINDMLILKDHLPSLTLEQLVELEVLKQKLGAERLYDLILENMPIKKTIPDHWHVHLLRLREVNE